jgi:hypothetical protein
MLGKGMCVKFYDAGGALHRSFPRFYPKNGTIGIYQGNGWVKWPKGSTSGDDQWRSPDCCLVAVRVSLFKKIALFLRHGK